METLEKYVLPLRLKRFCDVNEQFSLMFKLHEKLEPEDQNALLLQYLSREIFPVSAHLNSVLEHFSEFIPKLLTLSTDMIEFNLFRHQTNCILLGKVIERRPDLSHFASKYFENQVSPFATEIEATAAKKRKPNNNSNITRLDIVQCCYTLLKSNVKFYKKIWPWSQFYQQFINDDDKNIRWIACHCLAIISGMNEKQLMQVIINKMSVKKYEELLCEYNRFGRLNHKFSDVSILDQSPFLEIDKNIATNIVEISGVFVPCLSQKPNVIDINLVNSTYANLRKIALGLNSKKAICLQGPVGAGKTTLIEYVASKTGHQFGVDFVKIQLGDQTDSKMLLGTYRCTDVPGEFVWQPGVLTQAIIGGHWLLLEDIDSASMDIASVLSSFLENGVLAVPGYRDALGAAPGFQLFFTQRLVSTITGHHKKHSNAITLLEKHFLQINIDPLASNELEQIIKIKYPQFETITNRLVKVFHLFSENQSLIPKTSRLISTRDFFKWCSRSSVNFDISSHNSALQILQNAIDIFCCSYQTVEEALSLAREISTHLGIINQKAEYFFKFYKPLMKLSNDGLEVGRASLSRNENCLMGVQEQKYFFTRPSAVLLERITYCVNLKEPVLLVGETGTGKTSSVQFLASVTGQKLIVINMNQQSDSADLLGGFKPVDFKFLVAPIREEFEAVFKDYFKVEPNKTYLGHIAHCFNEQRWGDLLKLMFQSYNAAVSRLKSKSDQDSVLQRWLKLGEKLNKLKLQLKQKSTLAFAFIEGSLIRAVINGYWVLLDEINLANAETLECLSGLLEDSQGSVCLIERGDKAPVQRHSNFTLFACMNPSTDVGKKDLPPGLRNRFTEFFVEELTEKNDLLLLVGSYLEALSLKETELDKIVNLYLKVRKEMDISLLDGLGHKPHFSLRSLCRALMITARNPCGMTKKSLYEAFCLSFLTQLDSSSYVLVERMIGKYLVGDEKALKALLKQPIPMPKTGSYVNFEGYWVKNGSLDCSPPDDYILTSSVRKNLKDLVRIVSIGGLPVLLQGDTSVGKTSLIMYLAKSSGNKCVRINNHEHTDLQEYVGSYVADTSGKLVFREGLLVEAMRKGFWIILDELNLAPTDVLEALNRVLDDNRELFIPETQETVKAEPGFMLFATQNPPGSYGGRKMLSRAFRNRFVELHFNEIPPPELEVILQQRCRMPQSYARKMINVMTELQVRRRGSAAFAGKKGFITLRDLFRWGERYRLAENSPGKLYDWDQHLADEGYLVLAGRVRKSEEKQEIKQVLEKHLKREVKPDNLFTLSDKTSLVTKEILTKINKEKALHPKIVWTYNMRQLAVLVAKAFQFKEPVLLVGETGGGKTTVCQLIADQNNQELISVNCHMHTESSDFIGGLRPVRDHTEDESKFFEWIDGPLIQAMIKGSVFLVDEISLADDSVLERLNSLLEPERTLLLAEKGVDLNNPNNSETVVAHSNFYFIGTMNPGGDFGKKELSPALRNRFTEIWCESYTKREDLIDIIEHNLENGITFGNQEDGCSGIGRNMMDFIEWFKSTEIGARYTISIRDVLTWVHFINVCFEKMGTFEAYFHGLNLTFLDSLGSGVTGTESLQKIHKFEQQCRIFIKAQIHMDVTLPSLSQELEVIDGFCGTKPFYVEMGAETMEESSFIFKTPTTFYNTLRLLRGLQLHKAVLLEGSPGVGKTSLVTALAKMSRHKIYRVNLSDQTDISDLFGADLPVEGGLGGQFSWRDGPLLQALKQGHWILLDELNLASQSVLEGLNACLDHRGEIFIPELGKVFHVKAGTRFFACQNPLKQGGSRRGLPQSFLNRFIQVYVNPLTQEDLYLILNGQFSELGHTIIEKMLEFSCRIYQDLSTAKGAPWEFNLRDLTRWCEVTVQLKNDEMYEPEKFVGLIFADRMRTFKDKEKVMEIYRDVFGCDAGASTVLRVNSDCVFFGDVQLEKSFNGVEINKSYLVLRSQLPVLRSLALCVKQNWMSLLVGTSASGKSSVIHTLASLTGRTLRTLPVTSAMDTTEILGGFEQTDYSRHLEELVKETERILLRTLRSLLIKDVECGELLRLWEGYTSLETVSTLDNETTLFLKKISHLELIWSFISKQESSDLIPNLQEKARKIKNTIETEKSLNAGGKFEWVDSVLIKCLQDGSWLLVDNVNLCSSAVLDRLNALLEPKGVLIVSERGVGADGKMIEIVPHPDFRLFLTMDPKNGEISRAMRNRGIEIYVLNEKELNSINKLDIESLVNHKGLTDTYHIKVLIDLHYFISDFILGEKPNINELLRASELIAQQIQTGMATAQVFITSLLEIYYKTRSSLEFSCNDFQNVLTVEVEKLLGESNKKTFDNRITLKTDRLNFSAKFEQIKQQLCIFDKDGISDNLKQMIVKLVCYFSLTTRDDLNIRFATFCESWDWMTLNVIAEKFVDFISNQTLENSLLDQGWLGKDKLQSNNLVAALHIVAGTLIQTSKVPQNKTLYTYLMMRISDISPLSNEVIMKNLLPLLEEYDTYILNILKSKVIITHEDSIRLLELISWRYFFQSYVFDFENKQQLNTRFFLTLKVHYRWFLKYSVNAVKKIFNQVMPYNLENMLDSINKSLDKQFSPLYKISRGFQKFDDKPTPRRSFEEFELAKLEEQAVRVAFPPLSNRQEIINLIVDKNIKELKSVIEPELVENNLGNYLSEIQLTRNLSNNTKLDNFRTNVNISIDLVLSLLQYSQGVCTYHKLQKSFYQHCLKNNFSPRLVPFCINLLVDTTVNQNVSKLGNFSNLKNQHYQLNLTIWRNMQQLNIDSFDLVHNECQFLSQNFVKFFNILNEAKVIEYLQALKNPDQLTKSLQKCLTHCVDNHKKLTSSDLDFHLRLSLLYIFHMNFAYAQAVLNSQLSMMDPLAKKTLKKTCCETNIAYFSDLRDGFSVVNEICNGDEKTLHPHFKHAVRMVETLNVEKAKLESYVAFRPEDVPYDEVVKVVKYGFSTLLAPLSIDKVILTLTTNINKLLTAEAEIACDEVEASLKQFERLTMSYENLLKEWSKYTLSYPDIIEPLLANISEFLYGFKSSLSLLKKLLMRHEYKKFGVDAQDQLVRLVQIPNLDPQIDTYEALIENSINPGLNLFINYLFENDAKKETLRLLKCGIQDTFNNCIISGHLHFKQLASLINTFVESYNEQEKLREKADKEKESLYKIQTKCDDKPESEQIEDELKDLFPNYHQDFVESSPIVEEESTKIEGVITDQDIKFIVDLHLILVQAFTKTEWLNPDKNKKISSNFLMPIIEKYQLFKAVFEKVEKCLDYRLDRKLAESINVLLVYIQNYEDITKLVDQPSPVKNLQKKSDFYKDSNVDEVKSSFHILEELKVRINELLEEWPEHPTLKSILIIVDRLYSFAVTSPVSRFLTGFEILLSKCHEWEEVAHSGVSLSQYSQNLTQQIIFWRKMELHAWKDLLNNTFQRLAEPIYKWWFYLYNIMNQFIFTNEIENVGLIETLQNFVTKSNLAEFQKRLDLLFAFHCHAVHLKKSCQDEKAEVFVNIFWNIYNYFQQFNGVISGKIRELRGPIEKKLKDYVKIVRWKDVNYWAIKETVEKSHKTLHKYVREFQDALSQSVSPLLVNITTPHTLDVGIWDRPQRNIVKTYHYTLDPAAYVVQDSHKKKLEISSKAHHQAFLNRIDTIFAESRKMCKDSIAAVKYPHLIKAVDNFVTQVIETSGHLQGLEVDRSLPKEKQKSHAKSILNQKHRALADLFKTLTKLGISFRSGIIEAKLKSASEEFQLNAIDLNATYSHLNYNRKDEKILTIWENCENYYFKTLLRADVLETALKNPAPDLGLPNIERCRGFSANIMTLSQKHKKQLAESNRNFYYLRYYAAQMSRLCEAKQYLLVDTLKNAQDVMKNITIIMHQAKTVLNSCPEENVLNCKASDILILHPEPTDSITWKHDNLWSKASGLITEVINNAQKIFSGLEKSKGTVPFHQMDAIPLRYIPISNLDTTQAKLTETKENLKMLVVIFGKSTMSDSINWLLDKLQEVEHGFKNIVSESPTKQKSLLPLQNLVESLSLLIAKSFNTLHKSHEHGCEESPDEEQLSEDHLSKLILDSIDKDIRSLNLPSILKSIYEIAQVFFELSPQLLEDAKPIILPLLPLLEQTILCHQYFFTQQVSTFRIMGKMSSIMLNIFIDLVSKGFCVPPELIEDEQSGEGKPSDGLGLGEGQGEKDVSDRIESEDQLENAEVPNQEKLDENQDPDCNEEDKGIEMSEDFDSKLQDVQPKDADEENDEDEKSDGEEQMGETEENADRQTNENFASDESDVEEDANEQKEEKGDKGEAEGDKELGANEDKTSADKDDKSNKEKEENKKEINEMKEPELDDEQTDPYHGNQPELPEPEAMDLPDDLQLDDGEEGKDAENPNEENPFDIDTMKEDNPFEEKEKLEEETQDNANEDNNYSSDDEDIISVSNAEEDNETKEDVEDSSKQNQNETNDDENNDDESEKKNENGEAPDESQSTETNVQAMETDDTEAIDKTQATQSQNQKSNQPIEDLAQEDKPDKDGMGQSQMEESTTGHSAQTNVPQPMQNTKRDRDDYEEMKQQKPGESDSQRSLGDIQEPVLKKLKTIDSIEGEEVDEDKSEAAEADIFSHIKEANEAATQMLDVATKEQAEAQKDERQLEDDTESADIVPDNVEDKKTEETDISMQKPEKVESQKKRNNKQQHPDGEAVEEIQEMEVEGEIVETIGATRGGDSSWHTLYNKMEETTIARLTIQETSSLRNDVEMQLSSWMEVPSNAEAEDAWQKISSMTLTLAQGLSEQLRLVLEPTQASRLRGDFRTGRRINMRKIIPYIASQFRKDKIWLRRTQPSKREYQIVLAIDDSSSMADNHSKELAFESVSLVSKALSLLESGQLSVLSFGENVEIVHKLTDPFTDRSGVKLLQKFSFAQNKTCIGRLVDFVTEMFAQVHSQSTALNAKLLILVSDGRGVFSEGETLVKQAVRRAQLANIFMVFVIIDNPENKSSVLDIRMPVFKDGKLLGIHNYMDVFPFSFYIILRDINSMPSVLSDALRQWFEVVSNVDKQ